MRSFSSSGPPVQGRRGRDVLRAAPRADPSERRSPAEHGTADPLELQAAFAQAMLAANPETSGVYYVDDHFVPYAGAKPVAKGGTTSAAGPRRAARTRT